MPLFGRKDKHNNAPGAGRQEPTAIMIAFAGNLATRRTLHGELSAQTVAEALTALKAEIEEAKSAIQAAAPPERLTVPGDQAPATDDGKLLHMASWSERLLIREAVVLNPWQYARAGQYAGPYDIPDGAPRGREVTILGHEDFSRPELTDGDRSLQQGAAALLFMDDGRVMYRSHFGEQRAEQWSAIQDLLPDRAMALVDYVGAQVQAHRQNP